MTDAERFARALVDVYERGGFDGISDEMTYAQLDVSGEHWQTFEDAKAFLRNASEPPKQRRHIGSSPTPDNQLATVTD